MAENTEFKVVVGADISEVKAKLAELSSLMGNLSNNVSKSTKQIGFSFSQLSSKMSAFGSNMTASLSVPLLLLGKSLFQSASQIEQASISLKVFTGDAGTAKRLLEEFKTIAINSPMQFQDIAKGAQVLMGYGITANQVTPIVKMLGDISGGNADKFNRLSLAFGQVNSAGRLMGQEARQMINAGFNPLLAISEKTGESMASLSKRMRDGQISVQEVANAFYYATSEGGRFNGMAMQQSESLGGLFNKLSESVFLALADIGKALADNSGIKDFFKSLSDSVTNLKNAFLSISPEWQSFILKIGATLVLLGPVALVISSVIKAVLALRGAILLLTASTGGWLALIGLVVYGLSKLAGWFGETASKAKSASLAVKGYKESLNDAMDIQKGFKFDSISAQITTLEGKIKSLTDIIEKNKAWNGGNSIISNKQIDTLNQYKKDLQNLKDIQQKNLGFSETPSGIGGNKKVKAEKVEVIPGTDFITKEEGNKIKQLIELNRKAGEDIDSVYETSYERRLEKLNQSFEKQKSLYIKYGLDFKNIQSKYLIEYAELKDAIEQKKVAIISSAMNKSIAQFKDLNPFKFSNKITEFESIIGGLSATDSINAIDEYANSVYSAFKNFNVSLMSGFAEIAGTALSGGFTMESAFKSLGSMILNTVGDLLIQIGTSAVKLGTAKLAIEAALTAFGGAGIVAGMGAIAAGTAMKAFARKLGDSTSSTPMPSMGGGSSSGSAFRGITSGGAYQYGGSSYSSQSMKLSIDLTGAITASPTGYNINKSFETVLRVTGR